MSLEGGNIPALNSAPKAPEVNDLYYDIPSETTKRWNGTTWVVQGAGTYVAAGLTLTPEQFGAVGDGITDDLSAMQAMWDAAVSGNIIRLTPGKNYAQSAHATCNGKSLTVVAWGATISLLDGASADSYTWLAVNRVGSGIGAGSTWIDKFRWYGGTIDGNGFNQSYQGSTWGGSTGLNNSALGNTGLVGVWWCRDAMAVGVEVTRSVTEGICFSGCQNSRFVGCHGENAVPLIHAVNNLQGTMFKAHYDTTVPNATCIWDGCDAHLGSIAFQAEWSGGTPVPGSVAVCVGCTVTDMAQNSFHAEVVETLVLSDFTAKASDTTKYTANVLIANDTKWFHVGASHIDGGNIWGTNVSGQLNQGAVVDTVVIDIEPTAGSSSYAIDIGAGGIVRNCTVSSTVHGGINAEVVDGCKVTAVQSGTSMIASAVKVTNTDLGDVANQTAVDYTVQGINNFKGGRLAGVRVFGISDLVQVGVSATSRTYIEDCEAINTGGNAVTIDGGYLVRIRGGLFRNNGADNARTDPRRAAIGGSGVHGAVSTQLEATGVNIENDGTVATASTQALYWAGGAGTLLRYLQNTPVGMTTANTYFSSAGAIILSADHGELIAKGLGYGGWNYRLVEAVNQNPLTVGTIYAGPPFYLAPGTIVTNLQFALQAAASGTAPSTGISYGLATLGAKVVAQTAASTSFTSAGVHSLALTAPYIASSADSPSGLYYPVVIQPVAWGTTQPAFLRAGGAASALALGGGSVSYGTGGTTGQAALPANGSNIVGGIVGTNGLGLWATWT